MRRILAFITAALLSASAIAVFNVNLKVTSKRNKEIEFIFYGGPIRVETNSVKVCSKSSPLKSLTLWMPAHGHGSSEPTIGKADGNSCSEVTDLNFTMPGKWTLTAELENGDSAVLTIGNVRDYNL